MDGKWKYKCSFYPIPIHKLKEDAYSNLLDILSAMDNAEGQVRINQEIDCLYAHDGHGKIELKDRKLITTWKSLNIEVTDKGNVHIYFVTNMGGIDGSFHNS